MGKKIGIPIFVIVIVLLIIIGIPLGGFIDDKVTESRFDKEAKESLNEIEFEVPKEFNSTSSTSFSFYKDDMDCSIYVVRYDKGEKTLITALQDYIMVRLSDEVGEIEEKDINGKKAYSVSVKEKYGDYDYYALESSNSFYFITYKIGKSELDPDANACYTYKNRFISSIKVK